MRISDLIVELNKIHDEHGNLDIITAQDDEGNGWGALRAVYAGPHKRGNVYAGYAVDLEFDWWANVKGIHEDDIDGCRA